MLIEGRVTAQYCESGSDALHQQLSMQRGTGRMNHRTIESTFYCFTLRNDPPTSPLPSFVTFSSTTNYLTAEEWQASGRKSRGRVKPCDPKLLRSCTFCPSAPRGPDDKNPAMRCDAD
ncbi:hypothetical protein E2C01_022001 [Portunus trituberculatus]|uniref:Uncharacterized protein n=1 Tax=Portunus trituberculatus TaxID=210409 RepID=A0A5B7E495_PORTR|nr:hypothetical protein [Portunus trituberculatus]